MFKQLFSIIPTESTIRTFGTTHLSVVFLGLMIAYTIVKSNKQNTKPIKFFTGIMLLMYVGYYTWYYYSPLSIVEKALPLYTRRLSIYLLAIGIFFNIKPALKLGVYWSFFGGFCGLLFPSIFDYPFPHFIQINNFYLHSYIFAVATYYLFVERIGMTKQDTKFCCICTAIFLTIAHVMNMIIGSNYSSTMRTPGALLHLGITIPSGICLISVIIGYSIAIIAQYKLVNKLNKNNEEAVNNDTI